MTTETHNWSHNCCTNGIHHGRDLREYYTSLSEIDVSDEAVRLMVEQAIKEDAQELIDYANFSQEFVDTMLALWPQYFDKSLETARKNAERYKKDKEADPRVAQRREGETMSSRNDHVNYIVRVCGQTAFFKTGDAFREVGKSEKRS